MLALVEERRGGENKIFFIDKRKEKTFLEISLSSRAFNRVCARQVAETFLRPSHPPSVLFYIGKIHVA